jgi:hypothetical protein
MFISPGYLLRVLQGNWTARLLLMCFVACKLAAQTVTVGGTVYDPRTSSSLPIPNVLVYVTTGTVAPLPGGVQCLTFSAPKDAASYTYTAVDGTFSLSKVPQNTTYTLVIQAGKWRRQFALNLGSDPVTGLQLHMPANHTQGDIPMIAVATGMVDGVECVLHDMGIDDTEFTDDNGSTNPGGHIHLYKGSGAPGAQINASTPSEDTLTGDLTKLNTYDMVMFPCQGSDEYVKSSTAQQNLVTFANTGGRVFSTHYSYEWLNPNAPYSSQFPPVVNWNVKQYSPDSGIGAINTGFTDGATLAQWLQNAGASYQNTEGQIAIEALRRDFNSVIPPTQAWLTLNDGSASPPIEQITFNTPVGAEASAQCGRVLFNEYHVINLNNSANMSYPAECPVRPMTAQEEMLEYALFDLSAFVQPIVIPTLAIKFDPSPVVVKQNDTGLQVTISATNTSNNAAIDPSAVLKIALPANLAATALSDPGGGWICQLSTMQCSRQSSIGSGLTDSVSLTISTGAYGSGAPKTDAIVATVSSPTFSNDVVAKDPVIYRQPPTITWAAPAPILYGTPLSGVQLNATANVTGSFTYNPPAGTVLSTGEHALSASFAPDDIQDYTTGTAGVTLTVVPATPIVSVSATPNPAFIQNPVQLATSVSSIGNAPTGTVTFLDGGTALGSSTITAGAATLTTSSLSLGTHAVSATYSGDTLFSPAASHAVNITLEDFKVDLNGPTAANNTITVFPGSTGTYSLSLSPIGGPALAGDVILTADGLPDNAASQFSPATVKANSGVTTITFQVTPPKISASEGPGAPLQRALPIAFGLLLLPFARRYRRVALRWRSNLLIAITGALLLWGTSGCGGITYTPKTYNLTITGKAGGLAHTATVKLIVKSTRMTHWQRFGSNMVSPLRYSGAQMRRAERWFGWRRRIRPACSSSAR